MPTLSYTRPRSTTTNRDETFTALPNLFPATCTGPTLLPKLSSPAIEAVGSGFPLAPSKAGSCSGCGGGGGGGSMLMLMMDQAPTWTQLRSSFSPVSGCACTRPLQLQRVLLVGSVVWYSESARARGDAGECTEHTTGGTAKNEA